MAFEKDYKIEFQSGSAIYSPEGIADRRNLIFTSLSIPRGSWFFAPDYGHTFNELKKITKNVGAEVESRAKQATEWLINAKIFTNIEFVAVPIGGTAGRVELLVQTTDPQGRQVKFNSFVEIV